MDLLLKSRGDAVQQTFNNLYNNTPAGQAIQARQNFLAQTNPTINSTVAQDLKDPNVNPTGILSTANTGFAGNAELTSGLLGQLLNAATSNVNSNTQTAGSIYNNQQNNATQNRATSLQYGENDPNQPGSAGGTTLPNGMDAIDYVKKNGGGDLLSNLSQPEQYKVAQQIVAAGGVGNYRKTTANPLSDADRQEISGTNMTLTQISRINNQLKTSKHLQSVLDNPIMNALAKTAIDTGNQRFLGSLGLSPQDVQALGDLTALNAQGDRQLIGGRLTGYLSNKLSPAMPGLDKNSKQNQQTLAVLQKNIMDSVKSYSKGRGYNTYADIPGLNLGKFTMQAPNGQTFQVDQAEVGDALKNGWKEAQ